MRYSMPEFRIEKRRETADVTLVTGATITGAFFLDPSSHLHSGPERVGDLLNCEEGFFPLARGNETMLVNRAHVLKVTLLPLTIEAQLDAAYVVATRRTAKLLLTTGEEITGNVVVAGPPGQDRLRDYAVADERFRYVELADCTILVNAEHIVALTEVFEL